MIISDQDYFLSRRVEQNSPTSAERMEESSCIVVVVLKGEQTLVVHCFS